MTKLFEQIEKAMTDLIHGWTTKEKGCLMAACIVALRPKYSIEIGVYAGKGLVCMGLAHKFLGSGMAIGIDPYSKQASVEGQVKKEDKEFWSNLDHDGIHALAQKTLFDYAINNTAKIERMRSDQFDPPDGIGVLRIDANHSHQALLDAKRYAPFVNRGGIVFCDDLQWEGGGTINARDWMLSHGFKSLYILDEGANGGTTEVLQKT